MVSDDQAPRAMTTAARSQKSSSSASRVVPCYLPPLRDYQLAVLTSTARDDVTVSAPQLGKTIVLGLWTIVGSWRTAAAGISLPWWWTAPTYRMAEQGTEKLAEMARSTGMLRDYRLGPPRVTLRNGGVIDVVSWDVPENLYGPTVAGIAVDEFGHLTAEAHAALRSRVSETRTRGLGFMRYAGNVGEIGGEAEQIYLRGASRVEGWDGRTWTWRDRVHAAACVCGLNGNGEEIAHAELHDSECERGRYLTELANLQAGMSDAHFRQLYGAEWIDWSALPAYLFERSVHVTDRAEFKPGLPIDLACDFNVDPMCWILGQHKGSEAWAFDEIVIPGGATTQAACSEFLRRLEPLAKLAGGVRPEHLEVQIYGDRGGNDRSPKSHLTDYQIMQQTIGKRPRFGVNVQSQNPPVPARLNAFNAKLRAADGTVSYFVHPRCRVLANDLARVSLKPGTHELEKKNRSLTHASDADGYRMHRLYPVRSESTVRSKVVNLREAGNPAMGKW